jgi:hypothetical protein
MSKGRMMRRDGSLVVARVIAWAVMTGGSPAGARAHRASASTIREERAQHGLSWRIATPSETVHLTVTCPGNLVITREFDAGATVELGIQSSQDGKYT